jgi:DNA replication protein DnaC
LPSLSVKPKPGYVLRTPKRVPRLFEELGLAHADGTYVRLLARLAKVDVLILDDWGLAPLSEQQRRDVLEILEDRHGCRSTIVTSQVPVENWHDYIAHPTIADAVLDRLVHNAHKIKMKGPSRRKENAQTAA